MDKILKIDSIGNNAISDELKAKTNFLFSKKRLKFDLQTGKFVIPSNVNFNCRSFDNSLN